MGSFALFGQWGNDNCSLSITGINVFETSIIIDLPELESIISLGYSLFSPRYVIMKSILYIYLFNS